MTTSLMDLRLRDRLTAAIGANNVPETAVLAGHFAIYTAGGKAADFLDDPSPMSAHTDMVGFARSSWTAACEAVAPAIGGQAKLLVLVDDLQFVRPALPDRGARERLAAALAADYLRRTPTLPGFHMRELESRGMDEERVVRQEPSRWIFSERALRHAAVERVRGAAEVAAQLPENRDDRARLLSNPDGNRIVVRDAELGEHTIVHSGHTSCAGGYLELILQLHARGIRKLVAVVPSRCLGPVTLGTALARSVFGATGLEVVNLTAMGEEEAAPAERRSA
jgi:hypothetical protein